MTEHLMPVPTTGWDKLAADIRDARRGDDAIRQALAAQVVALEAENTALREACHRAVCAVEVLRMALEAMVDRWEPDSEGADRRMWEAARDALAATDGCCLCGAASQADCTGAHFQPEDRRD